MKKEYLMPAVRVVTLSARRYCQTYWVGSAVTEEAEHTYGTGEEVNW